MASMPNGDRSSSTTTILTAPVRVLGA